MSVRSAFAKLRRLLVDRWPDDANAVAIGRGLPEAHDAPQARRVVAVQMVEDSFYVGLFGAVTSALRAASARGDEARIELINVRSVHAGLRGGWRAFLVHTFVLGPLRDRQWRHVWQVVGRRIAYRSNAVHLWHDVVDGLRARRDWQALRTDPTQPVTIDGVECRDLVIDTFLRFRPSPRFDANDPFVGYLLWQARRDVRRARGYFRRTRPQAYLSTYSTYVQHGVPARVALAEGVPVFIFGSFQEFGKRLTVDDVFHTRNPVAYRREFERLPREAQATLVERARQQLEHRLAGGIDTATSYMAASAYRATTEDVPDVRGAVIVFLHDFYDSPHVYADLVFDDFWDWACFTIDTLRAAGHRFWLKPHPNQIALSDSVIGELRARYPELPLLAPGVTNRQLVNAGAACAVTVYGTVAHEMAYLGVPSIGCARHPHIAFDFCRTARDRAEYASLLQLGPTLAVDAARMREQATEFYVVHNLSLPPDQFVLREAFVALWKAYHGPEPDAAELVAAVNRFAGMDELRRFAADLSAPLPPITLRDHDPAAAAPVAELRRAL